MALADQRNRAPKVGKLMDRMFLTYRRNRLQGRQQIQYSSAREGPASEKTSRFPGDRGVSPSAPGGNRITTLADLRPLSADRFYVSNDFTRYESSSEEDNDSDYEGNGEKKIAQPTRSSGRRIGDASSSLSNRQQRFVKRAEMRRGDDDSADTDEDMYGLEEDDEKMREPRKAPKKQSTKPVQHKVIRRSRPKHSASNGHGSYLDVEDADEAISLKHNKKLIVPSRLTVPEGAEVHREWLQVEEQIDQQYCPQIRDRVVYFPQGHSALLSEFPARDRLLPWNSFHERYPAVECEVRDISFEFPPLAELRRCPSVVATITLVILKTPDKWKLHPKDGTMQIDFLVPRVTRHREGAEHLFTVNIRDWNDVPEFIVPYHLFARALKTPWRAGMEITVDYKATEAEEETTGMSTIRYKGKIKSLSQSVSEWPNSPWEALEVLWDTGEEQRLGPWEATLMLDESSDIYRSLQNSAFKTPFLDRQVNTFFCFLFFLNFISRKEFTTLCVHLPTIHIHGYIFHFASIKSSEMP